MADMKDEESGVDEGKGYKTSYVDAGRLRATRRPHASQWHGSHGSSTEAEASSSTPFGTLLILKRSRQQKVTSNCYPRSPEQLSQSAPSHVATKSEPYTFVRATKASNPNVPDLTVHHPHHHAY